MDTNQTEVTETQREYYDRLLKEKDTEIKILEMVIETLKYIIQANVNGPFKGE